MTDAVVASLEWLAQHRDDPAVRVVDVREPWEFDGIGHVPGAVNVPFETFRDRASTDPGTLPGADAFATLLGDAGIDAADTIVAYDDTYGVFAARFLLTAWLYGHTDARLLAGDYSAWSRAYETTRARTDPTTTTYEEPLALEAGPLLDAAAVEAALERDVVILDTREREEFETGRLPGAVRFDWRSVVDEQSRQLRSPAEIEAILAAEKITRDREILLYCNTARRISHTYVVLRWLGFEHVSLYEGSLTDWEQRDGRLETGPVS